MSQPSLLDFDALLAPISEDRPCGFSKDSGENSELVYSFSELRDLIQTARRIEAKRLEAATLSPKERIQFLEDYDGKSDGPKADPKWNRIAELSITILSKYTKDTRVLLSLTEAMPRLYGLPGLRDALRLCAQTLEQFKLALMPEPEGPDESDSCLQFLAQMGNSRNIEGAIDQAEVLPGSPDLNWFSYIAAASLEKRSPEERSQFIQDGHITVENFQQELGNLDAATLKESLNTISETLEAARSLDQVFTQLSDKKRPLGISPVIDRLDNLLRWFRSLVSDRIEGSEVEPQSDTTVSNTQTASMPGQPTGSTANSLSSREQALGNLLQVAAFFRKTEPHSPLSYSLEQAVRWGKMSLPDLLKDLVGDSSVLSEVYRRMGIQEKQEE
jgi:type VI secretion system protein ImpA